MTPAERIADALSSGPPLWDVRRLTVQVLDALMDGHADVHIHRHPDGTIAAVPLERAVCAEYHGGDIMRLDSGLVVHCDELDCCLPVEGAWVDSPGGAA